MQKSVFFAVTLLAGAARTAHAQTMVESGALTSRVAAPAMSAPSMTVPAAPAMSAPPANGSAAPLAAPQYAAPGYTPPRMTAPTTGGPPMSAAAMQPPALSDGPTAPEHPLSPAETAQMARDLPLFQAAFNGDTPAIKRALSKGAKVNSPDWQYGFTPLMWASLRGNLGSVRYLLSRGAKPNVFSRGGISIALALGKSITSNDSSNAESGLAWVRPIYGSPNGYVTALEAAAANGYNLTVRELLKNHADPNFAHSQGITPLTMAASSDSLPTVATLLDRGANVNSHATNFAPALQYAAINGNEAMIRLLLRRGADPTIEGGSLHIRPSMAARMMNHPAAAHILEAAARAWKPKPVPVVTKPVVKVPQPAPDDDDGVTILN